MDKETWNKRLELYDKLISLNKNFERKGVSMPHTSANGYMFSQLNKDGEIGIRLPEDKQEEFLKKYDASPFRSYGAVMHGYVTVPESLLEDLELAASYLSMSFEYVGSLKPK